jgi:hypothetical protein
MDVDKHHAEALTPADLAERGLLVDKGHSIVGDLVYERPAWVLDPRRIKDCTLGAFSLINGWVTTSMFRCRLGRYAQVGEQVILGRRNTRWIISARTPSPSPARAICRTSTACPTSCGWRRRIAPDRPMSTASPITLWSGTTPTSVPAASSAAA